MTKGIDSQPPWEIALERRPPADSPLLAEASGKNHRPGEQTAVTRRYDRMAWAYDLYNAPMEWVNTSRRRRRLLAHADGATLEVGVGTGRNISHYPAGTDLVAIDVSAAMLAKAHHRAEASKRRVDLGVADVVNLPYSDDSFDTAVATSVFCSVAEPISGLRELARVTKPDGRILLLEHVRPRIGFLGLIADLMTPVTRRLFGFRLNRRTETNIAEAGLTVAAIRRNGIWREIIIDPSSRPGIDEGSL